MGLNVDYNLLRRKRRELGELRNLPPMGKTYVPEKYRLIDLETGDVWQPIGDKWVRDADPKKGDRIRGFFEKFVKGPGVRVW